MRIQTKLTGFFVLMLAAFSYALVWISTQAYQEEVYRLNSEVSEHRLRQMYKIVNKEYQLFCEGAYENIDKAKRITLKRLETTFRYSTDEGYSFPMVILAQAHHWIELLESGEYSTLSQLAEAFNCDLSKMFKILNMVNLSPAIQKMIVEDNAPESMTLTKLFCEIPEDWTEQQQRFLPRPVQPE